VQYTGGWEDYAMLAIFGTLGMVMKHFKFSRPALLIGFILSERVEGLTLQLISIYTIDQLIIRPIFITLIVLTLLLFAWSLTRKSEMEFT
jgi:TctA family transporter